MYKICKYVANNRKSAIIKFAAKKCVRFLECYENASNYDFSTNGEQFVLETLAGPDFKTVLDVGANVGEWALLAHKNFSQAKIECFEILETTVDDLQINTSHTSRIGVNHFGLSNETGSVNLKTFENLSVLSSLVEVEHNAPSGVSTGLVERGDEFCKRQGITHIDFLKVDVEAAEFMVLQGFSEMLQARKIDVIQFEYGTGSIVTKFMLKDYYKMLTRCGYVLGKIYPNYVDFRDYDEAHEDFSGPNMLAVLEHRTDLIAVLAS